MKRRFLYKHIRIFVATALLAGAVMLYSNPVQGETKQELKEKISELEQKLENARQKLEKTRNEREEAEKRVTEIHEETGNGMAFGPLKVGGAMRANYTFGDYVAELDRPSRAEDDGGVFTLDAFRINLNYQQGPWIGKAEYRFYPGYGANNHDGYHFLHTGWVGYNFEDNSQLQIGVNRVPFGPGAYGVSHSWLFDQHYYVGLSDDMDLGAKYKTSYNNWNFDAAYYYSDEGSYFGENFSNDSVRYSYDVTNESGNGYEERHQVNLRGIYTLEAGEVTNELGTSLQYGQLASKGSQNDGDHYAVSLHSNTSWNNWTLRPQLTYYKYDVDSAQPLGTDELVQMGAYDFPTLVAAEAWLPAVSLSYNHETDNIEWLDSISPYIEYSSIIKSESDFNDSEMFVIGSAWASGGWYVYTDLAFSNGNDFVGNEAGYGTNPAPGFSSNRFGANPTDEWEYRVNINFGYYF